MNECLTSSCRMAAIRPPLWARKCSGGVAISLLALTTSNPLALASSLSEDFAASATPPTASAAQPETPQTSTADTQTQKAKPQVRIPASRVLHFEVYGQAKGIPYRAQAELAWERYDDRYRARQEVKALFLGSRVQTSQGRITDAGLTPERFTDERRDKVRSASFVPEQGVIHFSTGKPDGIWKAETQDRLSLFIQLAAQLAAAPDRYPSGTNVSVPTAGVQDVEDWTFTIHTSDALQLPIGAVSAVRLERQPRKPGDQKAEIWLAPRWDYLPARIRLIESDGAQVDLRLEGFDSKP